MLLQHVSLVCDDWEYAPGDAMSYLNAKNSTLSPEQALGEVAAPNDEEIEVGETLRDLARGQAVRDHQFDKIFPEPIRVASPMHWTPVDVARRAAALFDVGPKTHVLDIGSGAGKFCMVAALTSPGTYTGVEQRPHLVQMTRSLVSRYNIPRVTFLNAGMEEIDWTRFTGFYLYNPFIEHLYEKSERIDHHLDFSVERYMLQVRFVQAKLTLLPIHTSILTYHGFGGEMPPYYEVTLRERGGDDYLVLWERTR